MFKILNSVALHYKYRAASNGAVTLVFINSLGTDFRIWNTVVEQLPDDFGVLVYDKRGHGLSDEGNEDYSIGLHGDDLLALLESEGLENVILCGLSVGGQISLDVYKKRPEAVAGIILMDTAPKIGDAEFWQARIDVVRSSGIKTIADGTMERWFSKSFREKDAASLSVYKNMLTRTPVEGYAGTCEALRDADYRDTARTLSVPTLCCVGTEDLATPPSLVKEAAESIPDARYVELEGAGHLPCVEYPAKVAGLIKAFVGEVMLAGQASGQRDVFDDGMNIRRKVLGEAHVKRAEKNKTSFDAPFQRLITEGAWGHVWSRPNWTLRERSMVTIALLAALGHDEEVAMHTRATANTGASPEDLCEAMLHVAIYAGVPAANSAIKTIKNTLNEEAGKEESQ